jgi:acetyltransferase-like isoleucine patch superfamily enzyme
MKKILIIGKGRVGDMLEDIIPLCLSFPVAIDFADDSKSTGARFCLDDIPVIKAEYDYIFLGIAVHKLTRLRKQIFELIKDKSINIIHPTACISHSAMIGTGNYVGAFSYIGPHAHIGSGNFFSAHTVIEHHTTVGDLNSWGPGCAISGGCDIGDEVCMGCQVGLIWDIRIGAGSRVASGVCLSSCVGENSIVRKEKLNFVVKNYR